MIWIVAANEIVVGDVEVARAGIVREDADIDVFKPAVLHRKPLGAHDELRAGPDADIRIPDGNSLKVVVIGALDVEQVKVAVAIKYYLSVTRRLDHDRFLWRAAGCEVISSLERHRGVH